ncbi:MAG: DMT family transporter [Anaerolineales bacterium]|nr:DMT family transporter [Anaerolineales bacterium]
MQKPDSPKLPPGVVLPVGILAVSTASILIRYAQMYASSLTIAAFRLTLAALIIFPYVLIRHRRELRAVDRKDLRLALFSGSLLAVHFASWISSLAFTTVASSVVLVTTTPIWVGILGPVFLGERASSKHFWGMSFALLGGIIIGVTDSCWASSQGFSCPGLWEPGVNRALWGDFLALLGALAGAGYLMVGRYLRQRQSLSTYIFLVYGMAAVILVLVMLAVDGLPVGYPVRVYGWFVLLAVVPQLMGHTIFNWALKYLSTALVSISLLGEPVGSTLLAALLLGETPSYLKIFGAILILAGILTATVNRKSFPD